MNKFYITTTIPYVNADPHIGFALELVQADAIARYKRSCGFDVCFNWGTDEHGLKIYRKALEKGKDPKKYCDDLAVIYKKLISVLCLSSTNFIRTTDLYHIEAAKEFWKRCYTNGDIYKKNYRIKYCVGCELEKTDSDLIKGKCPLHPNQEIEIFEEENYFFRFSNYQKKLLNFYQLNSDFVHPKTKYNEIIAFVKKGLEDFSVSRLANKMPWGIPVPGDNEHTMYVWFDALINYISTIGWPSNNEAFNSWWPVIQVAGKDNLRQQSAIWQAMLMSAGLPNSKQILIHGFITNSGQKISKSLGNVIDPFELVEKYGVDAVRYYLLREIPTFSDGDFSYSRFTQVYNAELANNLGNLVSRIQTLLLRSSISIRLEKTNLKSSYDKEFHTLMSSFKLSDALLLLFQEVTAINKYIDDNKPWNLTGIKLNEFLSDCTKRIIMLTSYLSLFLPSASEKILKRLSGKDPNTKPLFPRL